MIYNKEGLSATAMLALMMDKFGVEFLSWEPETLEIELKDILRDEVSETNFNKLMAGISLITDNAFFVDADAFIHMCNVLHNGTGSDYWIPADLDDVLWSLTEAKMLLGEDYQEKDFCAEITAYIDLLVKQSGILSPPDTLKFAVEDDEGTSTYEAFDGDAVTDRAFWEGIKEEAAGIEESLQKELALYIMQLDTLPLSNKGEEFVGMVEAVKNSL